MAMKTKVLYIPSVVNKTAANMRRFLSLLVYLCLLHTLAVLPLIVTSEALAQGPVRSIVDQRTGEPPRSPPNPQDATDGDTPTAEFHMARMVYASGGGARGRGRYGLRRGWWAIDYPQAEMHFIGGIRRLTNIDSSEIGRASCR